MADDAASASTLLAIHLRPGARIPVRRGERAVAVAGKGLEGDHAGGGNRQVTLLSAQAWRAACAALGRDLDPGVRRANSVVDDPELANTIGTRLRMGEVVIEIVGETRPCELMDDDGRLGLQAALRSERRGGVYGRIVSGGELTVGMACVRES